MIQGIASVERKQSLKTGKTYFVVTINGERISSFDADIMKANGQNIDVEYKLSGTYKNMVSWSYPIGDTSNQSQGATPFSLTPPQTEEARQQSITRQSAMNQAVNLVSALLTSDNLPFPTSGKGAKAVKDPAVIVALVFDVAKDIKAFVAEGNWDVVSEGVVTEGESKEDLPF